MAPEPAVEMTRSGLGIAGGVAGRFIAGRLVDRERRQFVRLAGSSIAAPSAAAWISDQRAWAVA